MTTFSTSAMTALSLAPRRVCGSNGVPKEARVAETEPASGPSAVTVSLGLRLTLDKWS